MSRTEDKVLALKKKFGESSVATGRFIRTEDVVPTGILALDYALGTGGWPCGSLIEVFGIPDLGKSVMGLLAVREAQKLGKLCGWVAVEPGFDPTWAEKHGVNMDELIVTWPDNGLDAFNQMQTMLEDPDIQLVVFDSIGALLRPSEAELTGSPSQGGQAGLITWGVKRASMTLFKQNKYAIFINQVRDVMSSYATAGMVDSPGGRALKHTAEIRVQLKTGAEKYTKKIDEANVMLGREVIAEIKRTKRDEGTNKRAVFDLYSVQTDEYPFGVDQVKDVLLTSLRTGVIKRRGSYYDYPDFPDGTLKSKETVGAWMRDNPDKVNQIREKVIETIR